MWLKFHANSSIATVSAGVCVLGCYILTCSAEQFRLLALGLHVSKVLSTKGLFMLMTLALGGVSLFTLNLLELTGLSLEAPEFDSTPAHSIPIYFKGTPVAISVVLSCGLAFLGLYVASKDPMFAKTKKQIVDEFIAGAKGMTLQEVKAISSSKMFYVISTQKLGRLVVAGAITGIGVTASACLAVWSLAIPDVLLVWHAGPLIGSGIFSIAVSIVAFWILFRLLSLYPRKEILRIICCCVMGAGFIIAHYITMTGIKPAFIPGQVTDDSVAVLGCNHIDQSKGFYVFLIGVIVFCFVMLVLTVIDLRSWLYESSSVVHKHETMLLRLKALHTDNFAIIAKYMREVEFERSHHSRSSQNNSSAAHRGLESANDSLGMITKMLPFARGKVAPRSGGDVSTSLTDCGALPHSPKPHSVAPCSMFSIVEATDDPSALAASSAGREASAEALLEEGQKNCTSSDPPAVASVDAVASGISAKAAAVLSIKLPSSESIRQPIETTDSRRIDLEAGLGAASSNLLAHE